MRLGGALMMIPTYTDGFDHRFGFSAIRNTFNEGSKQPAWSTSVHAHVKYVFSPTKQCSVHLTIRGVQPKRPPPSHRGNSPLLIFFFAGSGLFKLLLPFPQMISQALLRRGQTVEAYKREGISKEPGSSLAGKTARRLGRPAMRI